MCHRPTKCELTLKPTIHDATKLHATVACNFVASCMLNFPCNKVANNIVACNFVASCMLKCCVQLCCTVYVDCCTQHCCMQQSCMKIKYCMQHCCMKSVACNMLHATLLYRVCYLVACNKVASCMVGLTFQDFSEYQILRSSEVVVLSHRAGTHHSLQFFETQLVSEVPLSFQVELEWNLL